MTAWNEAKHPRGFGGKFGHGTGTPKAKAALKYAAKDVTSGGAMKTRPAAPKKVTVAATSTVVIKDNKYVTIPGRPTEVDKLHGAEALVADGRAPTDQELYDLKVTQNEIDRVRTASPENLKSYRYRVADQLKLQRKLRAELAAAGDDREAVENAERSLTKYLGLDAVQERQDYLPAAIFPGLTSFEQSSLLDYVAGTGEDGIDHHAINNSLLRQRTSQDGYAKQIAAAIDSGISKQHLAKETTVVRIVTHPADRAAIDAGSETYTDRGFMSTTPEGARPPTELLTMYSRVNQVAPNPKTAMMIRMTLPKGAHAADVGAALRREEASMNNAKAYRKEDEILLPSNTSWHVKSKHLDSTGLLIVDLEMTPDTRKRLVG